MAMLFDRILRAVTAEPMPDGTWLSPHEVTTRRRSTALVQARVLVSMLALSTRTYECKTTIARRLNRDHSVVCHYSRLFRKNRQTWQPFLDRAMARLEADFATDTHRPLELTMKLALTSTSRIEEIGGLRCRLWEGVTESGIPCFAFVPLIAVHRAEDQRGFDRELEAVAGEALAGVAAMAAL